MKRIVYSPFVKLYREILFCKFHNAIIFQFGDCVNTYLRIFSLCGILLSKGGF
nr:MAG TPA: hypothetical protein [Caudoviricetes sp.]DAZ30248.1 MAG TPA: hypothetical protein [Caudoviricetes sp.]